MSQNIYVHNSDRENQVPADETAKTNWQKILRENILLVILAIGAIITSTLLLNFFLNSNVAVLKIYKIAIVAIVALIIMAVYQGKKDPTILISVYKTQLIVALISLPLVTGILGYSLNHYFAYNNEKLQVNDLIKLERDRRQGLEAVLLKDYKIEGKIMKKGEKLPLVTINNSVQEEQRGPNKFIKIYTPSGNTAWINLGDVVPTGKTVHCDGHEKNYDLSGKLLTVTFKNDDVVTIIDNLKIGQKYIITGGEAGKLLRPSINDINQFLPIPLGVEITNLKGTSMELKYKKGGQIKIKLI